MRPFALIRFVGPGLVTMLLTACAQEEATSALQVETDLTRQTLASAVCERGNLPAKIAIGPDGRYVGKPIGSRLTPRVSGMIVPTSPSTVRFTMTEGAKDGDGIDQLMEIIADGDGAVLRGQPFSCRLVRVRPA